MKRSKRHIFIASVFIAVLTLTLLSSCKNKKDDNGYSPYTCADITNFTVGYVPQKLYNNGQFSDADISATAEMDGESAIYMVIDFSYTVVKDIGNGHAISLRVRHSN
ncbi:MAG: hypothetical protein E7617_05490, partial [Ruminococcaceae bacterium]|nr:hypothetical protein [Oscillospiraceae bacterium]